ncbi:Calcium-responsive transcription factor [Chionoecetes opilio]|uniref:Calcium-responsive transcription factor n=1 Tax=Chionoecetes opilio TaxID=41210 RepID=A0A8J4YE64_CHIOP|nr:Calcium-responsive transcription factor [Chionoecetes opilio]
MTPRECAIKQEEGTEDDNKSFTVVKFRTLQQVVRCVEEYQQHTVTHFIKYNRDKHFGDESHVPNIEGGRIHYWSNTGKCGVPIEYDGVPFMHVGRWVLMCHQGQDINKGHKEKYQIRKLREQQESGVRAKYRNRAQVTKKVNCPAEIYITHVMKFPQHKMPSALLAINSLPTDHMRKLAKRRIVNSFKRYTNRFVRESWYYVRLPDPSEHMGHPVLGLVKAEPSLTLPEQCTIELTPQPPPPPKPGTKKKKQTKGTKFRTKEPVDSRVLQKMYELTRQGVSTVKMMQEAIAAYVHEELFPCGEPPPTMYRRYNPTPSDIQNAMYKVKQEMRLEGKSILQYRCSALVREITEMVVQTDSEDYLNQLEEQLRNIYNAVRNTVAISEVQFGVDRSEQGGERSKRLLAEESESGNDGEHKAKRGRRQKHIEQQSESATAAYHLSLENQSKEGDQLMIMDGELEQHQVHEIIQQEDGTIMEVYYYQSRDQLAEPDPRYHDTLVIQPGHMKTEPEESL